MENNSHKEVTSLRDIFQITKNNWLTFVILLAIVALAYGNLARGEFLNMDDEKGILYNPDIGNMRKMFSRLKLYDIQLAVTHLVFGMKPGAFHLVSVFLHYLAVIALFLFTYTIFGKEKALIASLLFASHPLASEAVGWVSAVHYIHLLFLTLNIFIFHTLFKRTNKIGYYIAEVGIFLFMVVFLRNAWVLTVPFSVLIFDQLILGKKFNFKKVFWVIPFLLMAGVLGYMEIFGGFTERVTALRQDYYYDPYTATPVLNRAPYIIYTIARLLMWPIPLTVYHEGVYISILSYVAMIIISLAIVIAAVKLYKKASYVAGLLLLIFVATLPSFSPVAIAWFIAERYLYMSTAAFCLMLAFFIPYLEKYTGIKNFTRYAVALLLTFYTVRTAIRTQDLLSTSNLWHATQKVSPYSFRVYNNLGDVYAKEGKYDLAIENFKKSIMLDPSFADAVHNLGYVYLQIGDYDNAWYYLSESYKMNPRLYGATYKLGVIAFYRKDFNTAKQMWEKTLELNPGDPNAIDALVTLSNVVAAEGQ